MCIIVIMNLRRVWLKVGEEKGEMILSFVEGF